MSLKIRAAGCNARSGGAARPVRYQLRVRLRTASSSSRAAPLIRSRDLAQRVVFLLTHFLLQHDVRFIAAPEWAFQIRRMIEAEGLVPGLGTPFLRTVKAGA